VDHGRGLRKGSDLVLQLAFGASISVTASLIEAWSIPCFTAAMMLQISALNPLQLSLSGADILVALAL
jgi:hypothetical protein